MIIVYGAPPTRGEAPLRVYVGRLSLLPPMGAR